MIDDIAAAAPGTSLDGDVISVGPEGLLATIVENRAPYTAVLARVDPDGTVSVAADDLALTNGVVTLDGGATLVVAVPSPDDLIELRTRLGGEEQRERGMADHGRAPPAFRVGGR